MTDEKKVKVETKSPVGGKKESEPKEGATSRERHKSAPYLRLKNSKSRRSLKYSFTVRKLGRIGKPGAASALKGGPVWIF